MKFIKLFLMLCLALLMSGCSEKSNNKIVVGTSADYPPFEYIEKGEFRGFDIELMNLIAKKLGIEIEYKDVQFSSLFPAINSGQIGIAISSIAITDERKANFDISESYFADGIAIIHNKDTEDQFIKADNLKYLSDKRVATQLGTTMEIWFRRKFPQKELTLVNTNNQGIESLKSKQIDAIVANVAQAKSFVKENPNLNFFIIDDDSDLGYGVVAEKGSSIIPQINKILIDLKKDGEIKRLEQKWIK